MLRESLIRVYIHTDQLFCNHIIHPRTSILQIRQTSLLIELNITVLASRTILGTYYLHTYKSFIANGHSVNRSHHNLVFNVVIPSPLDIGEANGFMLLPVKPPSMCNLKSLFQLFQVFRFRQV